MSSDQFSLVWNSFPRNLSSGLYTLLTDEQLVDVTLAAEGQILRAHKLILSVCSTYFRELFKGNSCKHPIVILKDVNYRDLSAMLHFMYQGEVNIKQEDIASFLKVAETLQIKGLTTESDDKCEHTIEKDDEDLDQLFEVERDKSSSDDVNGNMSVLEKLSHTTENERATTRQNISNDTSREESFTEQISNVNDTGYGQSCTETDYNLQTVTQPAFNERCRSADASSNVEQPLDCTADVDQPHKTKHEPLDYTMDMDTEQRHKSYAVDKIRYKPEENTQRQDFAPDTQLISHSQNSQTQAFSAFELNNAGTCQSDSTYDILSPSSKGRRTVKGIPSSSLPLETTLRVVSELGPTLRMERGKVIRMYSCPWCLRHFTRKENLKLHVRYIHGPLESLTCKLCGNKYKNSNSLRVHSYLYHNAKRDKHGKPLMDGGGM